MIFGVLIGANNVFLFIVTSVVHSHYFAAPVLMMWHQSFPAEYFKEAPVGWRYCKCYHKGRALMVGSVDVTRIEFLRYTPQKSKTGGILESVRNKHYALFGCRVSLRHFSYLVLLPSCAPALVWLHKRLTHNHSDLLRAVYISTVIWPSDI